MTPPAFLPLAGLLARGRPADHPVAWIGARLVPWQDFERRVRTVHAFVARSDARQWLLACADPFDFAVALFAVWQAGRRALIPPSQQPGAIEAVAGEADARLDDATLANLPAGAADAGRTPLVPFAPLDPAHCGLDLFTSGTSGDAQRIAKSLAQLDAEVATLQAQWGALPGPVLATAPHHHIYGLLFRLLWPLAAGRPFDAGTCDVPELLLARLATLGPALLVSSPAQLARLPELVALEALRGRCSAIFSSGGPLSASVAGQYFATLGQAPVEVYGSTETGGIAWRRQEGEDLWTPLPGVTVRFDRDGVLCLRSPFLPDAAERATGDGGVALADGRFRLTGRIDRVVKIEEKRLSLAEMESRLAAHAWVREAALAVLPARSGTRQRLGAAVVATPEGARMLEAIGRRGFGDNLRRHLAHWFDAVLLPRRWRIVPALPYNERGKLPAAAVAALFEAEGPGSGSAGTLPEVVRERQDSDGSVVLELFVPAGLELFAGHFPGFPILPGVAEVHWVMLHARRLFPLRGRFSRLSRLKFLKRVAPDTTLQMRLAFDPATGRIDFTVGSDAGTHASGRIEFAEAAAP